MTGCPPPPCGGLRSCCRSCGYDRVFRPVGKIGRSTGGGRMSARTVAAVLSVAVLATPVLAQQPVEQFYKGRAVTMLVSAAPGGINDIAGRLVAKHLVDFIPGHPTIVVQNMPGGGGLLSANKLYNASERDGSVIAIMERGTPQAAIQGDPNALFDPLNFTWLGSLSSYANDAYFLLINASHPAKSVADL